MRFICLLSGLTAFAFPVLAAERVFDFQLLKEGEAPPGWRAAVTGEGGAARWGVVNDLVPSELERLSQLAPQVNNRPVVAQLSTDRTDERFPLLIFDDEEYGDFKLTTKFKTVAGDAEQMAGIAFRVVDEKNYHVVRASSRGGTFAFYSFINGQRTPPVGVNVAIPSNTWHTLEIEASATRFVFRLNGRDIMPPLENPNFRRGKIGYWTKSDSISYFVDTRIVYQPLEIQAQRLVRSAMERYERLLGLEVLVPGQDANAARVLASSNAESLDQPGRPEERQVIETGNMMYLPGKDQVTVTLPLRDRNGEPVAAVRVTMKRFAGQTQKNALARAQPVVAHIQRSVLTYQDLLD